MLNISLLVGTGKYNPDVELDRHGFLVNTGYAGAGAAELRGLDVQDNTVNTKPSLFTRMSRRIAAITRPSAAAPWDLSDYRQRDPGMLAHRLHL